jgi:superfamily I DNA/RNA helicase
MRKVARLIEEGDNPARILVVTFTRTSAADLRSQLGFMGLPPVELVVASTLHSLCFRILGRQDVLNRTHRIPRTLYNFEVDMLLDDMGGEFGRKKQREERLRAYEAAWARQQNDSILITPSATDKKFLAALLDWLRFHRVMLVGELVPITLDYLRSHPESADRRSFEHILVDEYQDLNRADQAVIEELASESTLTVVGDDNQSIYSFRFAHPEGILEFPSHHSGTRMETLVECRRCAENVVLIANKFIDPGNSNPSRHLKTQSRCAEGEVMLLKWQTPDEEAEGTRKIIAAFLKRKSPQAPGDILVLVPRKSLGTNLRAELTANFISSQTVYNEDLLEIEQVRARLMVLQLLVDPEDRAALRYLLGVGETAALLRGYSKLRDECLKLNTSPAELLQNLLSNRSRFSNVREIVERYRVLGQELDALRSKDGQEFVDVWLPAGVKELESLRALVTDSINPNSPKEQMLQDIKALLTQSEVPTSSASVRIMTLHKAKGLSAHTVFVLGFVDGLIPTIKRGTFGAGKEALLAEQRRLFYMALTRAKYRVVLSTWGVAPQEDVMRMGAIRLGWAGRGKMRVSPSRFAHDLVDSRLRIVTGQDFLNELLES